MYGVRFFHTGETDLFVHLYRPVCLPVSRNLFFKTVADAHPIDLICRLLRNRLPAAHILFAGVCDLHQSSSLYNQRQLPL